MKNEYEAVAMGIWTAYYYAKYASDAERLNYGISMAESRIIQNFQQLDPNFDEDEFRRVTTALQSVPTSPRRN